jgi:3-mercaptopyruvate sulfurtransferase SseA
VRAFCLGNPAPNALGTWATDPAALTAPTLVSPTWLHARLGRVAVLDTRGEPEFLAWHVPGAQRLDLTKIRTRTGKSEHLLIGDAELAAWFGNLGIDAATPVVFVADDRPHDATMAALALLRLGHRALAILEGGMLRWATERRPLTPDLVMPAAAVYTPRAGADDFTITAGELAPAVQRGAVKVLDVRPPDFFRGEKSTEARPGHIPGAVNRVYTEDLQRTADGRWLRPAAELRERYEALGLRPDDAIAVSCRTGHQASQTYFVLRYLLGYRNVKWYAGSWTEWAARPELPAVTGNQ